MVKTLTTAAQAEIDKNLGTEPLIVIKIEWPSGDKFYADKNVSFGGDDADGAIVQLSAADSQERLDSFGEISSMNITLDDEGDVLKALVDTDVIEGTLVTIFQHFQGLVEADAIVLLKGKIASGMNWDEGERQLTFTVESTVEESEVGFAPESGDMADLHPDAEGVPWPLCFGTVLKIKAIRVRKTTRGILSETISVVNGSYQIEGGRDFPQSTPIGIIIGPARFEGSFANDIFTPTNKNAPFFTSVPFAARVIGTDFTNPAIAWVGSGDADKDFVGKYFHVDHTPEGDMINKCIAQDGIKLTFIKSWRASLNSITVLLEDGDTIEEVAAFPRTAWPLPFTLTTERFGDRGELIARYTGYILPGDTWNIFIGNPVTLDKTFDDLYVCNLIPSTEILEVWARREHNDKVIFVSVPSSRYVVDLSDTLAGKSPTTLTFKKDLEGFAREKWQGDIFVSLRSSVGNNTSDVIKHIVENFTDLTADAATFSAVNTLVANFPSNFCLFDIRPAIRLIAEVAWQARCAVVARNDTAFIKYLSQDIAPDKTLTEATIEFKTLKLGFTSIEDIITRLKAAWRIDYSEREGQEKEFIYTNNEDKYGLIEDDFDFFIYNIESLVSLSLNFWGYRLSNSWRLADLNTFINNIALEPFDFVDHNYDVLSDNTIGSQLKRVAYNTDIPRVTLEAQLASKTGDDTAGEPIEDANFWIGDPANPVFPVPAAPSDVGADLAQIDYVPELDPFDRDFDLDDDQEPPEELDHRAIIIPPNQVKRGEDFNLTIEIQDENGNRVERNVAATLLLISSDSSDVLSVTTIDIVNGIFDSSTMQITGGSGAEDEGFIIVNIPVTDPPISSGTSATFDITDTSPNIEWLTEPPKKTKRTKQFSVRGTGPLSTSLTVALSSTDSGDKLKAGTGGPPVTSILTDGSGNFNASDWVIEDGSTESTATISLSFDPGGGDEFEITERFEITDIEDDPTGGLEFINEFAGQIPAFAAMEIQSVDDNDIAHVTRPTADSFQPGLILFNGDTPVEANEKGTGFSAFDDRVKVTFDGATPSTGDVLETQTDDFDLIVNTGDGPGFVVQDVEGGARALVRPFRGIVIVDNIWYYSKSLGLVARTLYNSKEVGINIQVVRTFSSGQIARDAVNQTGFIISADKQTQWIGHSSGIHKTTDKWATATTINLDSKNRSGVQSLDWFAGEVLTVIDDSTDGINFSLGFDTSVFSFTYRLFGIIARPDNTIVVLGIKANIANPTTPRFITALIASNSNQVWTEHIIFDDGSSSSFFSGFSVNIIGRHLGEANGLLHAYVAETNGNSKLSTASVITGWTDLGAWSGLGTIGSLQKAPRGLLGIGGGLLIATSSSTPESKNIYKSSNGTSWTLKYNGTSGGTPEISGFIQDNNGDIWARLLGTGLLKSTNNGESWVFVNGTVPEVSAFADARL